MTRREITRCVEKWQRRLRLEAWEIVIDFDAGVENEDALAEVDRSGDYLSAELRLSSSWPTWSSTSCRLSGAHTVHGNSLDRLISHELLHLRMHDLDVADQGVRPNLHRDVADLWEEQRSHDLERAIEELARAFCHAYGEV